MEANFMSLPININQLINRRVVESARIEYKGNWNPEPIIHSICAFANDIDNWGGGYIIIGIEEENGMPKFPIKGIEKESLDRVNKELLQKCNLIEPRYVPVVEHTEYEGRDILILWVPGGDARPYKCPVNFPSKKSDKYEKAYYIRKMSNTIRAHGNEEKELFMLANNVPFDDRVNPKANIEELKPSLISNFLYEIGSELYNPSLQMPFAELVVAMRLAGGPVEMIKPLNVGLMFFSERPDNFFSYARIEVIDKPNPTGEGMTEKVFSGPLDRQLRDALSYIQNYIIKEKILKSPDRAEAKRLYNFPFAAVEEALSNAVYHKSYQIGEPITVTVTPEKMEITSLPGPDRTITDDDLKNYRLVSRRYRNRRIGDFLKELKLVEGRNTGIPTILKALRDNSSPMPTFETDEERTYFTVVFFIQKEFVVKQIEQTDVSGAKKRRSKQEIREFVISTLKENGNMSRSELVKTMGYAKENSTLSVVIGGLIREEIIEYLYPDNKHDVNQKLKLSTKNIKY
jgi:ATP-dependent DNA helicase RecG